MGGGGVVLMAKNLLKKNIIKALIGSSVKGIWMDYQTLIWINIKVSLSLMKHILVYISVSKLNYLFYLGKITILIFFLVAISSRLIYIKCWNKICTMFKYKGKLMEKINLKKLQT